MKERFNKIMQNGGFAVIVAVVAMGLYLSVMSGAQKCSADSLEPVEIRIDDSGFLYLHYIYDDKDDLMILWETDAGNLNPVEKSSNSLDYYLYSSVDSRLAWDGKDADGNEYEVATISATLYEKTEGKSDYYISKDVTATQVQMTVTYKDGKVVQTEDRLFSNPVRKDSDTEWSQIYLINEGSNGINTYRYRTGMDFPDEEYLFLRWESDEDILCETDIRNGMTPDCGILNSNKNKNVLTQVNIISIREDATGTIEAFIVTEDDYEKEEVSEESKINKAELEIIK